MAVAGFIALGALVLPYVVVPIRRSMGLPTYQWDADPKTHPVSFFFVIQSARSSHQLTLLVTHPHPSPTL